MTSALPLTSVSATLRRAVSSTRPTVWRETPSLAAASSWLRPSKSTSRRASTSSTVNSTCSRSRPLIPAGLNIAVRGRPETNLSRGGLPTSVLVRRALRGRQKQPRGRRPFRRSCRGAGLHIRACVGVQTRTPRRGRINPQIRGSRAPEHRVPGVGQRDGRPPQRRSGHAVGLTEVLGHIRARRCDEPGATRACRAPAGATSPSASSLSVLCMHAAPIVRRRTQPAPRSPAPARRPSPPCEGPVAASAPLRAPAFHCSTASATSPPSTA